MVVGSDSRPYVEAEAEAEASSAEEMGLLGGEEEEESPLGRSRPGAEYSSS